MPAVHTPLVERWGGGSVNGSNTCTWFQAKLKQLSAEATAAATTARNLSDAQGQVKALQLNLARADTREAELLEKLGVFGSAAAHAQVAPRLTGLSLHSARAESERSSAQTEASQAREKASKLERQLASALADVRRLDSLTAVQRQKLEDMAAELASRDKALSSARSEHGAAVKALRHRLAAAEARTSRQSTNDALARQQLEEETAALQRELDTTRKDAAHARRGASEARRELGRKQVELDAAAAALKQAQDAAAGASGATDRCVALCGGRVCGGVCTLTGKVACAGRCLHWRRSTGSRSRMRRIVPSPRRTV